MNSVYSVSQINSYIKRMFEQDILLARVIVQGEVSNCKYHNSGHIYFTLKDSSAELQCMMFRGNVRTGLAFRLNNGDKISASGRINVYEKNGTYSLIVSSIEKDGTGLLYQRFLELKEELEESGLFAQEYKKKIPDLVKRLGIVTAPDGAAVRDIINIAKRRNPGIEIIVFPAKVQGEGAAMSICRGLKTLDAYGVDVIIAGRGGGSIEDLWAFNEESVARCIFSCETPVISAVGHETDFTIVDFVADQRAPTPSAAAELAVSDIFSQIRRLNDACDYLNRCFNDRLFYHTRMLNALSDRLKLLSPGNVIVHKREKLNMLERRLNDNIQRCVENGRHALELNIRKLESFSPLVRLSGGYAYVTDEEGRARRSVEEINTGDILEIYLADGRVEAEAENVVRRDEWKK